jgi:hypothetical protein
MAAHNTHKVSAPGKTTSRKSTRASRPSFKAADPLNTVPSRSRPPLKVADSPASLSLTTSSKSLQNVSAGLDSASRSSSPGHISVPSDDEVDPEIELGMCIIILPPFLLNVFCQRTSKRPGSPRFIHSSSPMFPFSISTVDSVISSPVRLESARQVSEVSAASKTQRTRPRLPVCATMPSAVSVKTL